jgi:VIT1/CCC1 family predicted Fe2+/Mn2+ transporter
MNDRELIKRIMEEVKDEKLREELLRRVAKGEGSVEKILKRIEHRLKTQDSLAKQMMMHGRTEKTAKMQWWGDMLATPLYYAVSTAIMLIVWYFGPENLEKIPTWVYIGIALLAITAAIGLQTYYYLEGKKEYERRKEEEEELEK